MKPFKVGHSFSCSCCGEESCWGCEVARKELNPEYTQEHVTVPGDGDGAQTSGVVLLPATIKLPDSPPEGSVTQGDTGEAPNAETD